MRRGLKPDVTRPPDFAEFWQATLAELDSVESNIAATSESFGTRLAGESDWAARGAARSIKGPADVVDGGDAMGGNADLELQRLQFDSLGGARVSGYLLSAPGPRPLIVHSHGYGSQTEVRWDWARRGVNVLGVDIRGCGASTDAVDRIARGGYVLTGIESPETSILRGAICDYVRAVEVGRELLGSQTTRLVMHGVSFAGGLALMAEGLLKRADVLVLGVPTFGWAEGRHFFVKLGSGAEINTLLASHPERAEDVLLVLRYFDSMSFAGDVTCPTLVGLGLQDDVVPAKTVYAIANHLGGPHEVMEFPVSHSDHPDEALWEAFDSRCVDLALRGPPVGFGKHSN